MRIGHLRSGFAVLALGSLAGHQVQAATIATFDWVSTSALTGDPTPVTPSGFITLTLPGTVSTQTFTSGNATAAAALGEITGFSYTFSDGLTLGLSSLNLGTSTEGSAGNFAWQTSNDVTPAGGPTGYYLITGFALNGSKVFPGDPRAASFQIANSAGQVGLIAPDANTITPFAGQGFSSNDSGYWELESLTPVPLPNAAWLLVSGLAGLVMIRRRSISNAYRPFA